MAATPSGKAAGRILVVEDDWDILEVLKLMLEDEGHQVVTAKHGKAALAATAARAFDLVVMDISMPQMSGIEVARALRADPRTAGVYLVIHTGLDEHWVRERFADYDVFLTKAEDADRLVEQIARLLAQPRPAGGRTPGVPAGPTFGDDDVLVAQRALREAMGLAAEPMPLPAFIESLGEEIAQLQRLGHSAMAIAGLIGTALGREIPASAIPPPDPPRRR